jgi:hypothetical protein
LSHFTDEEFVKDFMKIVTTTYQGIVGQEIDLNKFNSYSITLKNFTIKRAGFHNQTTRLRSLDGKITISLYIHHTFISSGNFEQLPLFIDELKSLFNIDYNPIKLLKLQYVHASFKFPKFNIYTKVNKFKRIFNHVNTGYYDENIKFHYKNCYVHINSPKNSESMLCNLTDTNFSDIFATYKLIKIICLF